MSFASLASLRQPHASRAHPDPVRVAALTVAIALNLGVILMATRPLSSAPLVTAAQTLPVHWMTWIVPPAVTPPPAIVLKPLPHPVKVASASKPKSTVVTAPLVAPTTEGRLAATPTVTPSLAPPSATAVTNPPAPAIEASLAYRSAPLQFPVQALRSHMQGTVLLRVLVDESGTPIDVVIEQSSGHNLLDRSAREQVLAGWRFQPAIVDGKAVQAWARVPVSFDLHDQ